MLQEKKEGINAIFCMIFFRFRVLYKYNIKYYCIIIALPVIIVT